MGSATRRDSAGTLIRCDVYPTEPMRRENEDKYENKVKRKGLSEYQEKNKDLRLGEEKLVGRRNSNYMRWAVDFWSFSDELSLLYIHLLARHARRILKETRTRLHSTLSGPLSNVH